MDKNLKLCYFCRVELEPNCEYSKEFEGCNHKLIYCLGCFDKCLEFSACPFCSSVPIAPIVEEDNNEMADFSSQDILLLISLNSFSMGVPLMAYDYVQNLCQGPFCISQSNSSEPFIPSVYSGIIQENSSSFIISGGILKETPNKCRISNEILLLNILSEQNFQFYEVPKKKNLKNSRYAHSIFQFGDKLILVGGFIGSVGNFSKTTEILDENWKSKEGPVLNSNRTQFQGFFQANYLYIFGGFSGEEKIEKSFERLNMDNLDKWETINYKNQEVIKGWCSSFVFSNENQEIYILGGYDGVEKKKFKENIQMIKNNEIIEIGETEFSEINAVGVGVTYDQNFALMSVKYQLNIEFRSKKTFEYIGTQGIKISNQFNFKPEEKWFFIS